MAKKSSGAMGVLALLGIAGGSAAAYLLLKGQGQGEEPLHGATRSPFTCWNGDVKYAEMYDRNVHAWLPYQTDSDCPLEPADGSPDPTSAVTCVNNGDGIMDKAGPNNEAVVYTRVWDALNNRYVTDPNAVCTYIDGTLSNPVLCPDGEYYSLQQFSRDTNSWYQFQQCPTPPPATCRDYHPAAECIGDYVWDCVNNVWVNTGEYCGIPPATCRDTHPTSECISNQVWDCVNNVWVNTGTSCGVATCRDTHPAAECISDYVWDCINNVWVNTGVYCGPSAMYDDFESGTLSKWYFNGQAPTISTFAHSGAYSARTLHNDVPTHTFGGLWSNSQAIGVTSATTSIIVDAWVYIASLTDQIYLRLYGQPNDSKAGVYLIASALNANWLLEVKTVDGLGVWTAQHLNTGIPMAHVGKWTHLVLSVDHLANVVTGSIDNVLFSSGALPGPMANASYWLGTLVLAAFSADAYWDDISVETA